jgi:hypothetical protein
LSGKKTGRSELQSSIAPTRLTIEALRAKEASSMDTIDRTTITDLAKHHGFPAVSLYLPTHRGGAWDEDRIRLKNLLRRASDGLVDEAMRAPDAEKLLGEAYGLLEDVLFWRDMQDGMAVFVRPGETRILRVDTPMPEQCVVGARFYLRPLALAYHGIDRFFALVLDRNLTRLFEGDGKSIRQLDLDPEISSYFEFTKYDQQEEVVQFTTRYSPQTMAGTGRRIAGYHGHAAQNFPKKELSRWISSLEKAVTRRLGPENQVPLLLFGEFEEVDAYRAANTYATLAEEQIVGAADYLTEHDVQTKTLQVLEAQFTGSSRDLAELDRLPSALVSTDPAEIVSAAATGRVKTLFFDESTGPYGLFDRNLYAVSEVCSAAPRYLRETADSESADGECGWDLVDLAFAETVLHGGEFHAFDGEDAPVHGVTAVLRY